MHAVPVTKSDNSEGGTFLLDVPIEMIEVPVWLQNLNSNHGYKAKEEYHVTVIGLDLAKTIHYLGKTNEVQELTKLFNWTIELGDQYSKLAKDDENGIHRQSIILRVKVPEVALFYNRLTELLQMKFNTGPEHITLYTKNYDRGFGLYSDNDFIRYKMRDLYVDSL